MPDEPVTITLEREPARRAARLRFEFTPLQTEISEEVLAEEPGTVLAHARDLVKAQVSDSIDRQFDEHFERRGEPGRMSRPRPVMIDGEYRLPGEVLPGASLDEMRAGPLPFEERGPDYIAQARAAQRWWEENRLGDIFQDHPNCKHVHDSVVVPGETSLQRLDRQISEVTGSAAG